MSVSQGAAKTALHTSNTLVSFIKASIEATNKKRKDKTIHRYEVSIARSAVKKKKSH